MKKLDARGWLMALALLGSPALAWAQTPATSPGQAALDAAAKQQKYLFVLFYKQEDAATQAARQALDAALAGRAGQAGSVLVRATDLAEKPLIDRWGLSRSPMPLVLVIAPNGAVTGAFPGRMTEQDAAGAFVSPGMAACLKATQSRKLVLLCVCPAGTAGLPAGVRDFKADAQYGPATEVVAVRGDDPAEAGLLKALQIRPAGTAVTAFLAPPGRLLGTFDGSVTQAQLVEKLRAARTCCCPGGKCGPGGCCPGGKCAPAQ